MSYQHLLRAGRRQSLRSAKSVRLAPAGAPSAKLNNIRLIRFGAVTIGVVVLLAACFGQSLAQGLGGLGQLLGGGGSSRHQQQNSAQPNSDVSVERDVTPFVGRFVGKQKAPSYETDLNAEFACYPARDAALGDTKTFVCYTAQGQGQQPQQPHVPE